MKSRIEELEEENGALKETIESMESANPPAGGGNE